MNLTRMIVKMAKLLKITLLFCVFIISFTDCQEDCDSYAVTGGSFVVPLNYSLKKTDELMWKFNDRYILYRKPRGASFTFHPVSKISVTGDLMLRNLRKDQTGTYKPEVVGKYGGTVTGLKSTNVCVLDPVLKPNVKTECFSFKVKVKVNFTCDVDDQQNKDLIRITWFQDDKLLPQEHKTSLTRAARDVKESLFSCNVSNPVSVKSSDPVKQTCHESFILPDEDLGVNIWIFVVGGVLVLIVVIVCYVLQKYLREEEEVCVWWTNTQQQQHENEYVHQYNHRPPPCLHHHQPPSPGRTTQAPAPFVENVYELPLPLSQPQE